MSANQSNEITSHLLKFSQGIVVFQGFCKTHRALRTNIISRETGSKIQIPSKKEDLTLTQDQSRSCYISRLLQRSLLLHHQYYCEICYQEWKSITIKSYQKMIYLPKSHQVIVLFQGFSNTPCSFITNIIVWQPLVMTSNQEKNTYNSLIKVLLYFKASARHTAPSSPINFQLKLIKIKEMMFEFWIVMSTWMCFYLWLFQYILWFSSLSRS